MLIEATERQLPVDEGDFRGTQLGDSEHTGSLQQPPRPREPQSARPPHAGRPLRCRWFRPSRDIDQAVTEPVEIRRLASGEVREHLDALAAVLHDCVAGGASVSYMWPFSLDDARAAFEGWAADVERGGRLVLAAFADGDLVGTVQVVLALPPNQPHRAEIAKLLVHRAARGRGIARLLMERAEAEAQAEGRTLLVLDAVTGGDAARLYAQLGWTTVGVIPSYALYPDGRPCDTTVFWKAI